MGVSFDVACPRHKEDLEIGKAYDACLSLFERQGVPSTRTVKADDSFRLFLRTAGYDDFLTMRWFERRHRRCELLVLGDNADEDIENGLGWFAGWTLYSAFESKDDARIRTWPDGDLTDTRIRDGAIV